MARRRTATAGDLLRAVALVAADPGTIHPDTATGAKAALKEMSRLDPVRIDAATARPDPVVKGVWALLGCGVDEPDVVVYLGGYPDPFGNLRAQDDFEECRVAGEYEVREWEVNGNGELQES